jgi:hypothetical protein
MVDWRMCSACSNRASCLSTEILTTPLCGPLPTATSTSSIICSDTRCSIRQPKATSLCDGPLVKVTSLSSNDCYKTSASIRRPDNNYAVRLAAENGQLAIVDRLLQDKRVDPSADNNYAVRLAAENGHLAVVDRLLQDKRVDPSANANWAVRFAAEFGHLAVVDRLLKDDRVDVAVAIQCSLPEHRKRFECRERLAEICIALQAMELPAWITVQILDAARPWSTLPLHSKWNLVCAVKHYHDKHPAQ